MWVLGGNGDDRLVGGPSEDDLDGKAGADIMIGGDGSDGYTVDQGESIRFEGSGLFAHAVFVPGDQVIEQPDEGYDTIYSFVSYELPADVEMLDLMSDRNINGLGNDLDNHIVGNAGENTLWGKAGNDALDGKGGIDKMVGGPGNDFYIVDEGASIRVTGSGLQQRVSLVPGDQVIENPGEGIDSVYSTVSYTLPANVEGLSLSGEGPLSGTGNELNNYIQGNKFDNTLFGNAGNDTLDGHVGADRMTGGLGNDTYFVDRVGDDVKIGANRGVAFRLGDTVIEKPGEGFDTVNASVSYQLSANVEKLVLLNEIITDQADLIELGDLNGTGNALDNQLVGNDSANILRGAGGRDTLTGNADADTFVFGALSDSKVAGAGRDTIMDFHHGQHDRIDLHLIDASAKAAGNQAFHFIGNHAFSHHAGELQAKASGANTLVSGDVNGDGKADFAISLHGHVGLQAGDFVL